MTGRQAIEDLLEELYAARVRGDLETITRLLPPTPRFRSPAPTMQARCRPWSRALLASGA
jgi:hypothetical protein